MLILFPLTGLLLSALTVFLRGFEGIDIIFYGLFYFVDYLLLELLLFVAFLLVAAFIVDTKKPAEKFSRFHNFVIYHVMKAVLQVCNVKVKLEGEEKIPKGERFVLVQNHKAMFDPLVTLAFLGKYKIGFISKPENYNLPIINRYMHAICCLPIDRENPRNAVKSINAAADYVKNGICSMLIYPEGTRARDGGMLPLHAGSFKIAVKSGAPLVITTVDNTNLVHRNAPFRKTVITLRVCEVLSPEEVSAAGTAELAEKTRQIMCRSLGIKEEN